MPQTYAAQFRGMVVDQVGAGRPVAGVAAAIEVARSTVSRWMHQDRIPLVCAPLPTRSSPRSAVDASRSPKVRTAAHQWEHQTGAAPGRGPPE